MEKRQCVVDNCLAKALKRSVLSTGWSEAFCTADEDQIVVIIYSLNKNRPRADIGFSSFDVWTGSLAEGVLDEVLPFRSPLEKNLEATCTRYSQRRGQCETGIVFKITGPVVSGKR